MKHFVSTLAFITTALVSAQRPLLTLVPNHEQITVAQNDSQVIMCTPDVEIMSCAFRSPTERYFVLPEGAKYDGGKYTRVGGASDAVATQAGGSCGIRIRNVEEVDHGTWECIVSALDPVSGDLQTKSEMIDVTVAVPPRSVSLQFEENPISGDSLKLRLEDAQQGVQISCVAESTRPEPEFRWHIAGSPINGITQTDAEDRPDSNLTTFVSRFEYYPEPFHNGKMIACEVMHMAYSQFDLESKTNVAEKRIELLYKPLEKDRPTINYSLKDGRTNTITITFDANPRPTQGEWFLEWENSSIAVGTSNEFYEASQIEDANAVGEFSATLHILQDATANRNLSDFEGENMFVVSNSQGQTNYTFEVQTGRSSMKLTSGSVSSGLVAAVLILAILMLVVLAGAYVARSRGLFCFSGEAAASSRKEKASNGGLVDEEKAVVNGNGNAAMTADDAAAPPVVVVASSDAAEAAPAAET